MNMKHLWLSAFLAATVVDASPQGATPSQERLADYTLRDEEEIREALRQVLSSPEYRRVGGPPSEGGRRGAPEWWQRLGEGGERERDSDSSLPWDWRFNIPIPAFLLEGIRWLVYVMLTVMIIAMIALIAKAIRHRPSSTASMPPEGAPRPSTMPGPPGEHPSREYEARAIALAKAADYKAAIRQLLLGAMSWIERHRLIRYRHGLTNGDYLRALSGKPHCLEPLHRIIRSFEHLYFGRRKATAEGFKDCLEEYRRAFAAD